jgi:hypothetical protein
MQQPLVDRLHAKCNSPDRDNFSRWYCILGRSYRILSPLVSHSQAGSSVGRAADGEEGIDLLQMLEL